MRSRLLLLMVITLPIALVACGVANGAAEPDVRDKAAAEATAIIQQAEATAMVLQARAMATAMIEKAGAVPATPVPAKAEPTSAPPIAPTKTPAALTGNAASSPTQTLPQAVHTSAPTLSNTDRVQILSVSLAEEGGLIMVRFKAPPEVAQQWWQGRVSVVDEATGTAYNEIPDAPNIGPLIARPKVAGQPGYVMLVNPPPGLHPGAWVTVVLGNFKQEHLLVQ